MNDMTTFEKVPEISIVIPVYNIDSYIGACIQSIIDQTFKDFELILVNDGSSDRSLEICNSYAKKDSRIKVFDEPHSGLQGTRNKGLKETRGKYLAFIDGDDMLHPNYLQVLYDTLTRTNADISMVNHVQIWGDEVVTKHADFPEKEPVRLQKSKMMKLLFETVNYMTIWGNLYRREVVGDEGFSDLAKGEDVEFNSRIIKFHSHIEFTDLPLYYWRQRPNSNTRSPFSEGSISLVTSPLKIYHNLLDDEESASNALKRLYKNILSTRYDAPPELKGKVAEVNNRAIDETLENFKNNKYISKRYKFVILTFLKYPFSYKAFRALAYLGAKLTPGSKGYKP